MNTMKVRFYMAGAAVFLCVAQLSVQAEIITNRFAFSGPEIFPLDSQIGLLHSADIDGDGLKDLVLAKQFPLKNQSALQSDGQDEFTHHQTVRQARNE